MSDISQIDGQTVRRKREALGLAVSDVATTACLSTKQIKQIEEGGMTAFYSENVKLTAARKVAALLGMTEAQLLIFLLFLHLTIRGRRRIDLHFRQDWFSLRKMRLLDFLHLEGALWRSGCTRLSLILSVLTKTNEFIAIVGRDDSCTWFLHNLISKNNLN